MNKKRWEGFSSDIQKIIEGMSGAWAADMTATVWGKTDIDGIELVKKLSNHEIINLSLEERAKWRNVVKPMWDEWVRDMEAKGLPGKKILDGTLHLVERYTK